MGLLGSMYNVFYRHIASLNVLAHTMRNVWHCQGLTVWMCSHKQDLEIFGCSYCTVYAAKTEKRAAVSFHFIKFSLGDPTVYIQREQTVSSDGTHHCNSHRVWSTGWEYTISIITFDDNVEGEQHLGNKLVFAVTYQMNQHYVALMSEDQLRTKFISAC